MNKLKRSFFVDDPTSVAKRLIGCFLIRKTEKGEIRGRITETEAYGDATDLASHARFGLTPRNKIMYGKAGIFYVYHIYGIFYLTNIICGKRGVPGAVLLRSAEILEGDKLVSENLRKSRFVKDNEMQAVGPGKLSLAFKIEKTQNYLDAIKNDEIYLQAGDEVAGIIETKRIGIDYAKHCKDLPWRYYEEASLYINKK